MTNPANMLDQAQGALIELAFRFGPKLLVALLILTAGFYAGRWVGRMFEVWLARLNIDVPVRSLLVRLLRLAVLVLFFVVAMQNLGIDLLPLIAGVSVAGAGVALAMQGVLSNLTAGLTIIFTRPFRVGEYVSIVGVEGRVEAIDLFSTKLSHADQSIVVVPNRKIVGEILHNYGQIRQLDLSVTIGSAAGLPRALAAVEEAVHANPRTLKEPAPIIGAVSLRADTIVIAVKPWVKVADFAMAAGEINRAIVESLEAAGVEYPPLEGALRLVTSQAGEG